MYYSFNTSYLRVDEKDRDDRRICDWFIFGMIGMTIVGWKA